MLGKIKTMPFIIDGINIGRYLGKEEKKKTP